MLPRPPASGTSWPRQVTTATATATTTTAAMSQGRDRGCDFGQHNKVIGGGECQRGTAVDKKDGIRWRVFILFELFIHQLTQRPLTRVHHPCGVSPAVLSQDDGAAGCPADRNHGVHPPAGRCTGTNIIKEECRWNRC